MTTTQLIDLFNLYSDNSTELSASEELDLLNRIIKKIGIDRPWEALKTQASGAILGTGGLFYITLPADFAYFAENNQATDIAESVDNNAAPKVIFVGGNYSPYQIINFSDRRSKRNTSGFVYLDLANNRVVFTADPSSDGLTYEFDYVKVPATLVDGDDLTFPPERFQVMIAHLMSVDEEILEKFPRANSYAADNRIKYEGYLRDLSYYNSQLNVS